LIGALEIRKRPVLEDRLTGIRDYERLRGLGSYNYGVAVSPIVLIVITVTSGVPRTGGESVEVSETVLKQALK
jgi:hypothetical protein